MTEGGRLPYSVYFPALPATVPARLCRSPCTAAPHPGRGLLLLRKTELAGEDVGRNMSYGAGAEGSGSFRSPLLGLARHAGVSGRPGGSPGARVTGDRAPLLRNEEPLQQKVDNICDRPERPPVCWLFTAPSLGCFFPLAAFSRTHEKDGWR